MPSVKCLYVYNNNVYEIPRSRIKDGKKIEKKLTGKTVLEMEIIYSIEDRKPKKFLRILFNRVTFNSNGIYDFGSDSLTEQNRVQLEYAFRDITEALSHHKKSELSPLPIPKAPIIPSEEEIVTIKSYLNRKYPNLLNDSPYAIEYTIKKAKENHKEKIRVMKDSYR
ncbi:hypothetical protein AQ616_15810 [Oceanobacillus sp. E9]|uniref:hypothetical protein n=1 Tax=Oceanobacillus TaxID=182709 RepID=UPI00084E9549|nr:MULTISPECIES: hypothetical protein [Oceanobacillus]OEH53938.1 hypothetical protein AQ616_15810 [Oceanobacillus sp. E9]